MFIFDDLGWDGNWLSLICYLFGLAFGVIFITLMVGSAVYLLAHELIECLPTRWRNRNARTD